MSCCLSAGTSAVNGEGKSADAASSAGGRGQALGTSPHKSLRAFWAERDTLASGPMPRPRTPTKPLSADGSVGAGDGRANGALSPSVHKRSCLAASLNRQMLVMRGASLHAKCDWYFLAEANLIPQLSLLAILTPLLHASH